MTRFFTSLVQRVIIYTLIQLVGHTTRKTWINRHILDNFDREGRNYILSMWHNNILGFVYVLSHRGLGTMISPSRDGDLTNRLLKKLGYFPVRGSSSRKGFSALRGVMRILSAGSSVVLTPDGPQGPRYVLKPGIPAIAQRVQVPIIPLAWSGPRMFEFNSWDRMKLPLPFSRIIIYVGNPIHVAPDEKDQEAIGVKVEHAMRLGEAIVDRFAQGDRTVREPLLAEAAEADAAARA